jgi:hypothetical protein
LAYWNHSTSYGYILRFLFGTLYQINLNLNIKYQQDKTKSTETPALALPDTSGEILKARMAQALRAFLCLSLSEDIRLNPVIIGIRLGIR